MTTGLGSQRRAEGDSERAPELQNTRIAHSETIPDKTEGEPRPAPSTLREKESQPYLQTITPRAIATKNFIDYKTLREQEQTNNFSMYLH